MKIHLKELANISDEKVYPVSAEKIELEDNLYLRRIENVKGEIAFYYDDRNKLIISYALKGKMVCPDAYTLEDVEVPFDLADEEEITYRMEDEGFYLEDGMELEKIAINIVLPEAPIKVVKNSKIEYSRGDSWSFVSEEEYADSQKDKIDPRWEKLKDYQVDEED